MPSLLSHLVPIFLRVTRANRYFMTAPAARDHLARRAKTAQSHNPPRRLRAGTTITESSHHDWPIYTIRPADSEVHGAVIYLHGGAWVEEIAVQHWQLAAQLAAEAKVAVIVPIYPLVPFGTASAVNEVVVELARSAREEYGTVSLAGDSAGGQIAISAALALRDEHGETVASTVLISPAVDPSMKNPEMDVVQPRDPWLGKAGTRVFLDAWRGDIPNDDPRINPLEADLRGLGPLMIFSGTRDILNPDARLLVARARAAGVDVDYREAPGLVHVYPLTPTPEGRAARAAIVDRLRGNRP